MIFELIYIFLLSVFLTYLLIKIVSTIFYKLKILDKPWKYWYKRDPVPYSTGIVFYINFFILSLIFIPFDSKLSIILFFWFIVTLVSFLDDFFEVSPKLRLLMQIVIWAFIWITSIKIWYISNIFWWIIDLNIHHFAFFWYEIFTIPLLFTIFWYVLIFNALNWSDWIPGLTSWLSFISFFVLFLLWIILFYQDDYVWWVINAEFILKICLIVSSSLGVYWFYDSKEKILMWDSWTMFLGFLIATIAIISGGKVATVWVALGIYLIDAFYVITKRILSWKNPLHKDFTHLHHRLLNLGLSKKQVLILVYFLSFSFWITALFLDKNGKIVVFFVIAFIVIFINNIIGEIKKIKK